MLLISQLPVVPAQGGGGSCLRFDCKTFFIYRTCMRHASARCCCPSVRASLLLCCCPRTWPMHDHVGMRRQANVFFTLHSALFTARTSHYTLHTPNFISSHLESSDFFSPHLTSSQLFSSNPIPSHMSSCHLSKFFSTVFISSEHWKKLIKFISTHLSSSARQKDLTVRVKSFAQKSTKRIRLCTQKLETQMHLHRNILTTDFVLQSLHKVRPSTTSYYKACTKYVPVVLRTTKLAQSTSQYYFVLQSLHKVHPITTLYYKACTKHFPVLLRTTKLAQSTRTSQNYFVLQSLHKVRPSTTSYYKACTKYVPALLRTTKLAQSTSRYYFVLQSLHKGLPSTTSYYKARTKYFPVLLCTSKLAQSTSPHYLVLQSLHKALPSTILYYKASTKHFPALLCTSKLAQSTSKYYFVQQSLHKAFPSTTLCSTKLAHSTSQYYFVLHSLNKAPPSTTLYYNACTQHFPVLLCTTKLAQSTSPHYLVLQSLHKALPSTILYYKASTKHFPVLLCTTMLAQSISQYYFVYYKSCTKHLEPIARWNDPSRPHTRGTFHRRLQPLYTEKHKVSCSGFLPRSKTMQPSCSHYTAICNQRVNKRMEPRTHEQPLVAEHRRGTDYALKRSKPHPPHTRGTFHRRLQPLYTEKLNDSCSGFLPKSKPMRHSCCHYIAICKQRVNKRIEPRTHEQPLVAEHRGGTEYALKQSQPHPPHTRDAFHRSNHISGLALPSMIHNKQLSHRYLLWNFRHRLVQYYWYMVNIWLICG